MAAAAAGETEDGADSSGCDKTAGSTKIKAAAARVVGIERIMAAILYPHYEGRSR